MSCRWYASILEAVYDYKYLDGVCFQMWKHRPAVHKASAKNNQLCTRNKRPNDSLPAASATYLQFQSILRFCHGLTSQCMDAFCSASCTDYNDPSAERTGGTCVLSGATVRSETAQQVGGGPLVHPGYTQRRSTRGATSSWTRDEKVTRKLRKRNFWLGGFLHRVGYNTPTDALNEMQLGSSLGKLVLCQVILKLLCRMSRAELLLTES